LWAPRDVVGGDFYFMFEVPGALYVGVADCTGHGVPGALMSVAAYSAIRQVLTQAVEELPALDALLGQIDNQLRDALRHGQIGLDYGMDLAVCRLAHGSGVLEFAGCGIDAYIIGLDSSEAGHGGPVRCLASRKRGLGYRARGTAAPIPVHRVALGDTVRVYLPSDGVFDQPGGEHGFGFGRAPFERVLVELETVAMDQQAGIFEQIFKNYRGASVQRDDITLLGFSARAGV
jgi:serine phosphatase RsbU (regulator of sigma subunit)